MILVIGGRSKIGPALFEELLAVASGCGRLFVLASPDGLAAVAESAVMTGVAPEKSYGAYSA